jgi:uncharacterized phage protein gp47/JayE
MPVDTTITDAGPRSYTLAEVRAARVADWRAKFGQDADTDPEATDGLLVDLGALPEYLVLAALARLWSDSFLRSARAAAVDGILDAFGKRRRAARPSAGSTVFYGDENIAVGLGTQVQTTGSAAVFATTVAGTTGALAGATIWMLRVPAAITPAVDYSIDIDATIYTHTALGGDTSSTVATALRDLVNAGAQGTGTRAGEDSSGRALLVLDLVASGVVANDGSPTEPRSAVRLAVEALVTGPTTAPAGTLQVLPTPIVGIDAASNDTDATPGRDIESDDAFRARHFDGLFGPGSTTDGATRARVLALTDEEGREFVASCSVRSNRSSVVDVDGRPPHSFETLVQYFDDAPTDADRRVAEAIGVALPVGIQPWGLDISETIETYPSNFVLVEASVVQALYLHLRITVTPGEGFPVAGDPAGAIRTAVVDGWDGRAAEAQNWYQLATAGDASAAVGGTASVILVESDLTALPGDAPAFAAVLEQVANAREIIDLDGSRVDVVIL